MIHALGYIAYHIGLYGYILLVHIVSLWNKKARKFINGRCGLLNHIAAVSASDTREKIWFHCASLGEFEQARPVMERFKRDYPQYAIVVTFFSPSGYEIRKNYTGADYVFYLPMDSTRNAERFLAALKIKIAFFVKYEIWYHYLVALKRYAIPVVLISANIRPDHIYLKWYGVFFTNMLKGFSHIFSQNPQSDKLLRDHGFTRISVSKDTRFDRVSENRLQVKNIPLIQKFVNGKPAIVLGSSYAAEETLMARCMDAWSNRKIIIAPHHIEPARINDICNLFATFGVTTYSALSKDESLSDKNVLVIDNIGMLSAIYQYADIAFIGGGFGKSGLHNTLEAAVFGMPVLFGPNNLAKFPESLDMIAAGVAFVIKDTNDLKGLLNNWVNNPIVLQQVSDQAKQFVESQTGATQHIFDYLRSSDLI